MLSSHSMSGLIAFILSASPALAQFAPFTFCTDNECSKCGSSVTSSGTGYPNCVVYNSDDIFANQGYQSASGGGYDVFFNVAQPNPGCATIVKSPASTTVEGCGTTVGAFYNAACAAITIGETFMVQFCCGSGDCNAAGAPPSRIMRGARSIDVDSFGSYVFKDVEGMVIEPVENNPGLLDLGKRKDACTKGSWQGQGDQYTIPAANTQVVSDQVSGGTGGSTITVTAERSQSWTNELDAGLSFEDIFDLGVSSSMTKEESDSQSVMVNIPAGQTGELGFTAIMTCAKGSGQCNGGTVSGTVCWPSKAANGDVYGKYAVIETS